MKLLAFVKRDYFEVISYRFSLLLDLGGMFITLLMFYFLGQTFSGSISPYLERYGGEYFPYVIVGIAVSNFVTTGLSSLASEIRAAQVEGTLEALLSTPTSIYTVLLGTSMWNFVSALFNTVLILTLGVILLDLRVGLIQGIVSFGFLLVTFIAFLIVGMLSASFIIIFKEGDPIKYIFGWSSFFLGSVIFPVEVLPAPFHLIAQFLPITHAVKALRELILASVDAREVIPLLANLVLFIGCLAPVSILVFRYAVKIAKRNGNLVQY